MSLLVILLWGLAIVISQPAAAAEESDELLWLEEVTAERALRWVKRQNAESTKELAETSDFETLNQRLLAILDSTEKIPYISKRGDLYYNLWRDAKHQRGLWRRTTLAEYRQDEPQWETVLDLDQLAKDEDENWVWKGVTYLKPDYRRCLLQLSRGGADATVIREFDTESKQFVEAGFFVPEAKSRLAWRSINSLFVATDFGPGSLTESGYPRIVKQWQRGRPLDKAETVLEGESTDVAVGGYRDLTKGYQRDFVSRSVTFWTNVEFLRRNGELTKLDKPDDANADIWRDWLFIELRSDWSIGGTTYPAGALLAINFNQFLSGAREFDVLFQPTSRKSLAGFDTTRNYVLLNELDNVRNRLYVLKYEEDGSWSRRPLPGAPEFSTVSVSAVDRDESDDYFMNVNDYLTPPSLRLGTIGQGPAEQLKQNPAFFDSEGLVVSQHEALSKDGTRIPYFQVARHSMQNSGQTPTLLYGYGGFEISLLPYYDSSVGAGWLEKGGVYVVANIRGGGEFGPQWHQAALKENRSRAYEDFVAVAEDLIRRKITAPKHLGIMGGSNGGLLMGNMLTMRPDLFGAIVCKVPLLDMFRYHNLLAGASWMAEYGDPDDPEQWKFIRSFSPYHNVKKDQKYPRVLFTTSTRDDRVHPGHARKMVARMKEMGHDVLYYENIEGGHGGAANNKQAAFMSALAFTFLWNELN